VFLCDIYHALFVIELSRFLTKNVLFLLGQMTGRLSFLNYFFKISFLHKNPKIRDYYFKKFSERKDESFFLDEQLVRRTVHFPEDLHSIS
jgi:hypothetical protein